MKMSAGEASILGKLEQLEHNIKKIMEGIIALSNWVEIEDISTDDDGEIYKLKCLLSDQLIPKWNNMDQELKELKKLKAEAKKNGYTLAQYKKKLENDK